MLITFRIDCRFRVSDRLVHALASLGQVALNRGLRILHRRLGLLLDALHRLPELGKLALAHGLVELSAELGRLALDDAHVLADGAQQCRQVLGTDDEQRHDAKDQELAGSEVEHRSTLVRAHEPLFPDPSCPDPCRPTCVAPPVMPEPVLPEPVLPEPVSPEPVLLQPALLERVATSSTVGPQPIRSWRSTRPCWAPRPPVARLACRPPPPKPWAARPSWRAHRPRPCPS